MKLCSSTHFFTTASSFTIFTRALKTSNGIRDKPFGVQLAQLVLVIVMVRRAKHHPAQAALRDKRVDALRRLGRRAFGLIKRGEMIFEDMRDGLVLARPRGFVERADEQRLRHGAVRLFLNREPDGIAFRLLQNQQRNLEQRIRPAGHLDLARELIRRRFLPGINATVSSGSGAGGSGRSRAVIAPVAATETAFAVAKLWTGRGGRAAATFTDATRPSRRGPRRSPGLPLKRALRLDAFVAGELFESVGLGFSLRPRGLEEIFQIEVESETCS